MSRGLIALILAGVALVGLYLFLFFLASGGQGYPGPKSRGWIWYFGPTIYQETPSARTGSPGGPDHAGGGQRAGK